MAAGGLPGEEAGAGRPERAKNEGTIPRGPRVGRGFDREDVAMTKSRTALRGLGFGAAGVVLAATLTAWPHRPCGRSRN